MCGRCDVLVGTICRWCVDCVVYWLGLTVGDVWTVWYTGWWENNNKININIEVLCVGNLYIMDKKINICPYPNNEGVWGRRGVAPLILNLGIGYSKWSASRSGSDTRGKNKKESLVTNLTVVTKKHGYHRNIGNRDNNDNANSHSNYECMQDFM